MHPTGCSGSIEGESETKPCFLLWGTPSFESLMGISKLVLMSRKGFSGLDMGICSFCCWSGVWILMTPLRTWMIPVDVRLLSYVLSNILCKGSITSKLATKNILNHLCQPPLTLKFEQHEFKAPPISQAFPWIGSFVRRPKVLRGMWKVEV